jgi:UDP-glucuronate decarboxylase
VKKRVLVTGGAGFLGFEIYNLACPASPIHYQHDPVQTTKTSVLGAINRLGLAKRLHARILQASTSEVYGDPHVHPQTENYRGFINLAGPRACYDEGKRCAETLFYDYKRQHRDYKRQHRLAIRVARIFNTYGPNMHPQDGRAVSSFIIQALKNEPITICGSGSQTRSFCYVDDLIDRLTRLMNVECDVDGAGQPRQSHRSDNLGAGPSHNLSHWLTLRARIPSAATGRSPQALP